MVLRLVNTHPGKDVTPLSPAKPIYLGLRALSGPAPGEGTIEFSTLRVSVGHSAILLRDALPNEDPALARVGGVVSIESPERVQPKGGATTKELVGATLRLHGAANPNAQSIYEISAQTPTRTEALAYFKIKIDPTWQAVSPSWCTVPEVAGVYLGLEHGEYNNACYVFLKTGAQGSLVVGGPQPYPGAARPAQKELTLSWLAPAFVSKVLELWIHYNLPGRADNIPIVEVWAKRFGVDTDPVLLTETVEKTLPVLSLGEFPSYQDGAFNYREGPSETSRMFLGFTGAAGEVLEVQDFGLFPTYATLVKNGRTVLEASCQLKPDAPISYKASDGLPQQVEPSRWFAVGSPETKLVVTPGAGQAPQYLRLSKTGNGAQLLERDEPRLEEKTDGFMLEAFMAAGIPTETPVAEDMGVGFSVDDGEFLHEMGFVAGATFFAPAVRKASAAVSDIVPATVVPNVNGTPMNFDWRSPRLYRLVFDRIRGKKYLSVDEERLTFGASAELPVFTPPTSTGVARIRVGRLQPNAEATSVDIFFLTYLQRYKAWESEDGLPAGAPVSFSSISNNSPGGSLSLQNGRLLLTKASFGGDAEAFYCFREEDLTSHKGVLIDFDARVQSYTGATGILAAPLTSTGVGVQLFFGDKTLQLVFVDCGTAGRRLGIIPGSGSVADLVTQTILGRAFSAPIDWMQSRRYRLVYKAFDKIEVWTGALSNSPAISIPWRNDADGFDLPDDTSEHAAGVGFGHLGGGSSSKSVWNYIRFGQSNGYDVSVRPLYSAGVPANAFGGKVLSMLEVAE